MARRLMISFILTAFLGATASSCIIHTHEPHRYPVRAKKAKKCPPSHYWDGKKCRHKGKGKGARKHDY
jgi:hypothetical protein